MEETFVRLRCPACAKDWEASPSDLPAVRSDFECPDCGQSRPLSEFARTDHDLDLMKQFEE